MKIMLKEFFAFAITYLIMVVGLVSALGYFETPLELMFSFRSVIFLIGASIIFFPAFNYWLSFTTKLFNIQLRQKTDKGQ